MEMQKYGFNDEQWRNCKEAQRRGEPCWHPMSNIGNMHGQEQFYYSGRSDNMKEAKLSNKQPDIKQKGQSAFEWQDDMKYKWPDKMTQWLPLRRVPPEITGKLSKLLASERNIETADIEADTIKADAIKIDPKDVGDSEKGNENLQQQATDEQVLQMWKYSLAAELERLLLVGKSFGLDLEGEIRQLKEKVTSGNEQDLKDIEDLVVEGWNKIYKEMNKKEKEEDRKHLNQPKQ